MSNLFDIERREKNIMKKKLVSALLVAAMAVTMAAGCGSKEEKVL